VHTWVHKRTQKENRTIKVNVYLNFAVTEVQFGRLRALRDLFTVWNQGQAWDRRQHQCRQATAKTTPATEVL
jgi:hypothetical protein